MLGEELKTDPPNLSPRIRDVFEGLIVGLSEKELASQLGISRHTVHGYVQRLYRDAGVSSRGELLAAHIRRLEMRVAELERERA